MEGTILIIEDEVDIADLVAARLRSEGFQATVCFDGPSGVARAHELEPDLVILDLMLPGLDGVEVCRRIQQRRATPVVMLTAKDDESDVLIGLGVGADDYITKPFSPRELVARVRAVLRRTTGQAPAPGTRWSIAGVEVVEASRRVTKNGEDVHLTATEFDLLASLLAAGDAVLTREQLLFRVWGYRDGTGSRTVDSHVRSIRRKLGDGVIRTVHGVGYALGR